MELLQLLQLFLLLQLLAVVVAVVMVLPLCELLGLSWRRKRLSQFHLRLHGLSPVSFTYFFGIF